ncbi:hypothetical protein F8388_026362 [Cannabis sativa]|uniref:Uncharacterized protein n=1 Tax=Cannabis sativa TaxID=3483 RepID=A0A7J6E4P5_CANSA|nr:hypothetical protein F8388_026362 [Cannabis sativa]
MVAGRRQSKRTKGLEWIQLHPISSTSKTVIPKSWFPLTRDSPSFTFFSRYFCRYTLNAYSVSRTNSHFVSLASWSAAAAGAAFTEDHVTGSNKNIEIKHPENISFGTTELELAQSVKDSSNCQVKIREEIDRLKLDCLQRKEENSKEITGNGH